ncbi:von Hippel-Lindau tumor suppressor homolog [Hylaeus anthracinus]|uniref:von Hippel-Lindau tumor suppressor homolog n=1 Tax=Hylaeus anthracinus TaxID=313031 RepID=UPI0023B8F299|nr:von Hippel-Lindau tumor suppressor homolog [Hylaeus anthracinus]
MKTGVCLLASTSVTFFSRSKVVENSLGQGEVKAKAKAKAKAKTKAESRAEARISVDDSRWRVRNFGGLKRRIKGGMKMGENQQQQQQQQQQQPQFLRSINNDQRTFVKFINTTQRHVGLYWIDYQGQAVSYGVLTPDEHKDINTFVTHPWIFVDNETNDRYTVNQRDVFFPQPWQRERLYVYITLPLYTLREMSLRTIKRRLSYDLQAFHLDIPRSLQFELAAMLPKKED